MSRVRRHAAIAIALALVALAGDAAAGPAGRLVTSGRCPGRGHMEAALTGVIDVGGGGQWTIAIAPDQGGARLTLRDRRGAVALERRLESRDCAAMARAFAVILHAFFQQLAAVRGESAGQSTERVRRRSSIDGAARAPRVPRSGTPRVAEPSPRTPGVAEPSPLVGEPSPRVGEPSPRAPSVTGSSPRVGEPSARVADPAGSTPDARPDDQAPDGRPEQSTSSARPAGSTPSARPDGSTPSARPGGRAPVPQRSGPLPTVKAPTSAAPAESSPARRVAARAESDGQVDRRVDPTVSARSASLAEDRGPGPGIDLGLAAGGSVSETAGASAFGLLEVGWRFGRRASLRFQASGATPTVQDEREGARVELQHSALVAGLGYQLGGRAWFRPAVLAGVAAWRVDALEIEGPTRLRVQPIVTAVAAAGVRLGRGLSLRVDVGLTTYLRTDRFLVQPDEEIARSPRTALAIGAGIEWASFR